MPITEHARIAQHAQTVARTSATRQAVVSAIMKQNGTGASSRWIISQSGRSKSTVNRTLQKLIDEGIVIRFPDPFDSRVDRYRLK